MTNANPAAAAIATARANITEARAAVVAFAGDGYVIAANSGVVMTVTTKDANGGARFNATNAPQLFGFGDAKRLAASWNRATAGEKYDMSVSVMSVADWKAARALELDAMEKSIDDAEAGNV